MSYVLKIFWAFPHAMAWGRAFGSRFCPKNAIEVPKNLPFGEMSLPMAETEGIIIGVTDGTKSSDKCLNP